MEENKMYCVIMIGLLILIWTSMYKIFCSVLDNYIRESSKKEFIEMRKDRMNNISDESEDSMLNWQPFFDYIAKYSIKFEYKRKVKRMAFQFTVALVFASFVYVVIKFL